MNKILIFEKLLLFKLKIIQQQNILHLQQSENDDVKKYATEKAKCKEKEQQKKTA